MKLLLFVHTDPRKTNRSATVRVQKGDYKIESNHVDSVIDFVFGDGSIVDDLKNETVFKLSSPHNIYLNITKAGTEPHLTTYLVSV